VPVATRVPLAPLTTLRLGGEAERLLVADTEEALVAAVREADAAGEPLLVLAGGSNVVIADAGFPGLVVRVETRGVTADGDGFEVQAGEPWDPLVARMVAEGRRGFEALSGIPGSAGATPIQNVGAYGQEVATSIVAVRVLDRGSGEVIELAPEECGFRYRSSVFKGSEDRVVLATRFRLPHDERSDPIRYGELARALGVEAGGTAPLAAVREAVLALRRGKGMVVDPADPDSVSAGSFFTNPILPDAAFADLEERVGEPLPRFPAPEGSVKTSAAWLIEHAGFGKGYERGRVGISHKHALALVTRGGATTADLVGLAREIVGGVRERFGVELRPEPVFVGHSW
jgi:UDP-N-acetylmuramate dehydrogenase